MSAVPKNPWLGIPTRDYEGHMGREHADQLGPLNAIFAQVYHDTRPGRLALLGCATGNGLEHVDPGITSSVVAVDVNPEYVATTRARHRWLGDALDARCADLCSCELPPASFDLVHAALIFEHVEISLLASRIVTWLAPQGTCAVVLQVDNPDLAAVTPSPYQSMAALAATMHVASPQHLTELLERDGLHQYRRWAVPLKGGKQFAVCLFRR